MMDQDWIIKIEKKLTAIQKDIEFIKERLPICEKEKVLSMIKINRWIFSLLLTTIIALIGAFVTKI